MAFFKFRLPGQSTSSASSEALNNTPAESLEVLRKRARHRLIGSVVLVLAAVIGFPLLFDTQPRPVSVDTAIVIPERNAAPAAAPSIPAPAVIAPVPVTSVAGTVSRPAASASAPASGPLPPAGVLDANEEVVASTPRPAEKAPRPADAAPASSNAGGFKVDFGKTGGVLAPAAPAGETKPEPKVAAVSKPIAESKPEAKPERKPEPKAEPKVETKAETKVAADKPRDEAAKARALLEGKEPAKANDERLVIQVGAYNDAAKVREARQKLEAAGFKTYTQVIDSKDGKRTRVRVGPFESKAEADKSAQKIRKLQLDTAILKL